MFYSRDWTELGTKLSLSSYIAAASGIAERVIRDRDGLNSACISEKMSWAALRTTTRPEDESYALMGIFGVNMPPLYGEGRENAFRRLQLEIMQASADHTLFAWNSTTASGDMLAPHVSCFVDGAEYRPSDYEQEVISRSQYVKPDFTMTNVGLHIQLPRTSIPRHDGLYFAFLACKTKLEANHVAICLQQRKNARYSSFFRSAFDARTTYRFPRDAGKRLLLFIDNFDLIYVSTMRPHENLRMNTFTRPLREVEFNVLIKAETPYQEIVVGDGSQRALGEQVCSEINDAKLSRHSLSLATRQSRFFALALPLQHCIAGCFATGKFHCELIQLCVHEGRNVDIVLGNIGESVWIYMGPARIEHSPNTDYEEVADQYYFPTGHFWQPDEDNAFEFLNGLNPTYRDVRDIAGTQYTIEVAVRNDQTEIIEACVYLAVEKH